jgi:alcohol dehydrogenase class IV
MHPDLFRLQETFFNTQENKRFYSPSKIHWGRGIFSQILSLLQNKRIILFYDQAFERTTFLEEFHRAATGCSIFLRVSGPPSPEEIAEFSEPSAPAPDFVVAFGGGSTIDFAKGYLAYRAWRDIDGIGNGSRRGAAPIEQFRPEFVAIPTTAGTGAECSRYYVTYALPDKRKVHGKSWMLVADWVFLDPEVAVGAPFRLKVESAFDAFMHLTESHLCMQEETWINSALSMAALHELRSGMGSIIESSESVDGMLKIMTASTVGGMVISNVRTGHIHEMAGAFLEKFTVTHPQSLWVFFKHGLRAVMQSDAGALKLAQVARAFGETEWSDVEKFWDELFERCGSKSIIQASIISAPPDTISTAELAVINRTISDKVWIEKECPVRLSGADLSKIYKQSLEILGA